MMMHNENDDTGSIAFSDLCAQVRDAVQACRPIKVFVQVYESTAYQQLLTDLRQSFSTSGTDDDADDTWARSWAVQIRMALDGPDFDLNQRHRTVLETPFVWHRLWYWHCLNLYSFIL
jgi:hypothetical protein